MPGNARSVWKVKERWMDKSTQPLALVCGEWLWTRVCGSPEIDCINFDSCWVLSTNQQEKRCLTGSISLLWRIFQFLLWIACTLATSQDWRLYQPRSCNVIPVHCQVNNQGWASYKVQHCIDGWTEGTHHYIGIGAAYLNFGDGCKEEPVQTMLSMKPLLVDSIQGMRAPDHLNHVEKVLESYGTKTFDNIVCLVGDNCSVNQCMTRILDVPLIGCASHKFNLAVRQWISQQTEPIPIVKKVCRQVSEVWYDDDNVLNCSQSTRTNSISLLFF